MAAWSTEFGRRHHKPAPARRSSPRVRYAGAHASLSMKLNILSDLHLGFSAFDTPQNDADVVVLAGDISRPREAAAWALRLGKPVLYVPGNHEFYDASIEGALAELKRLCAGTPVHLLDDAEIVLDGVRFLGSTLWTDFEVFGSGEARVSAMDVARRRIRDFTAIRIDDANDTAFAPEDAARRFRSLAGWLRSRLDTAHAGPTVVITHHAPSPRSIHPRFEGSPVNACFVSDLQALMGGDRVQLWVHGHTHDSFDYEVNGTRVVCNPRGYARGEVNENRAFDPQLTIEVGGGASGERRSPTNGAASRGKPAP
jgi:predicted phosphodiesterase